MLPFSHDAFLDVFGAYNSRLWPVVVLLWAATAGVAWLWLRRGRLDSRALFALLAVHWAWSGVAYHWFFFRAINPAASVFAAMFVAQAMLFTWLAAGSRRHPIVRTGWRGVVGVALVLYGLVYPVVGLVGGLEYPRMPLFAVPCPTALVTAGFLVAITGVPRVVLVMPIVWSVIGSSAAFALGIRADLALVAAGAALAAVMLVPSAAGLRAT